MDVKDIPIIPLDTKIFFKLVDLYGAPLTIGQLAEIKPEDILNIRGIGEKYIHHIDTILKEFGINWLEKHGYDKNSLKKVFRGDKYKTRRPKPQRMSTKLHCVLAKLTGKNNFDLEDVISIKFIDMAMCRGAGIGLIKEFDTYMHYYGIYWLSENGFASIEQAKLILKKRDYFKYDKSFNRTDDDIRKYLEGLLP